jgi:hypothetical protein
MPAFLMVNTLVVLLLIFFILLIALGLYARKVNTRLNQSIKLINDLYKLNQSHASKLEQLLGDNPGNNEHGEHNGNDHDNKHEDADCNFSENAPMLTKPIQDAIEDLKLELTKDVDSTKNSVVVAMKPLSEMSKRILALEHKTDLMQQEHPEFKRYSRANALVKEGASIEDIMEASQLPRAEVEVLLGLQRSIK